MNTPSELEVWRAVWKTPSAEKSVKPFDLHSSYRRQERRLRIRYVSNAIFAVVLICLAALVLRSNPRLEVLIWALVVWITTLGATAFNVWNWRILWRAADQSVLDYAGAFRKQCLASLRTVRFGYSFLALQLAITVPWLTLDLRHGLPLGRYAFSMGFLALFSVAFVLSFRKTRSRALLDLKQIEEFRRELEV